MPVANEKKSLFLTPVSKLSLIQTYSNPKNSMDTKQKNYVLPIAMMFALFAMISFVTGLSNPMGVIIKNQPGIQNWMSQLGNFANFFAYLFMGLPAGIILKRKGYKFTALTAIAVGFLGVGIQLLSGLMPYEKGGDFVPVFLVYLSGAFVSGFSMCMLNTVVNPLLNTLGGGGKKGNQLIQFGGSLNSFAATIVPILGGYLIGNAANAKLSDAIPALLIAMGIFAVAFLVLSMVAIPEPHLEKQSETAAPKDKHSAMSFRHFLLGTVAIFLYVGVEVGIPNFINLFLTAAQSVTDGASGMGIDAGAAGTVVGTYWFLMLVGRLAGGFLGGKFAPKVLLTFVCSLALILIVAGIFLPSSIAVSMPVFKANISFGLQVVPLSVLLFVLCGLCTSVMWGSIFNLAVEGIGKYTAMGSGIFMVMVVGGGVLPLLQGLVADVTVSYMSSYWVVAAALVYMLWYALAGCKNVNKDIPVE
jgi:FHS family L-fucose permease-like MFS transporter